MPKPSPDLRVIHLGLSPIAARLLMAAVDTYYEQYVHTKSEQKILKAISKDVKEQLPTKKRKKAHAS